MIGVLAEQQLRRHALDQQQLVERIEVIVFGGVGRGKALVIIELGPVLHLGLIGVHPVENRVGDFESHIRQRHQQRFGGGGFDGPRGDHLHQRVQVELRRFVGNAMPQRLTRRVPFGVGNDAESATAAGSR